MRISIFYASIFSFLFGWFLARSLFVLFHVAFLPLSFFLLAFRDIPFTPLLLMISVEDVLLLFLFCTSLSFALAFGTGLLFAPASARV